MRQSEIRSLTGLRGVAAIAVMTYHFRLTEVFPVRYDIFFDRFYIMVDIFFLLSGFVLSMSYGQKFRHEISLASYASYVWRRLARIYPLYILLTVVALVLILFDLARNWPGPPLHVTAVFNVLMIQNWFLVPSFNSPAWSLSAEWFVSLIFPILAIIGLRWPAWIGVVLGFAAFVGLQLLVVSPMLDDQQYRNGQLDIWHYSTVLPVARCVLTFYIGIVLFRLTEYRGLMTAVTHPVVSTALAVAIVGLMLVESNDVFIVFLMSVFVLSLTTDRGPVAAALFSRPVYALGLWSYGIYLFHNLMYDFLLYLQDWLAAQGVPLAQLLAIGFFSAVSITAAWILHHAVEMPARAWMQDLGRRVTPAPAATARAGR